MCNYRVASLLNRNYENIIKKHSAGEKLRNLMIKIHGLHKRKEKN